MAKYLVQVPFIVVSDDYMDVEVEADSETEAKYTALYRYLNDEDMDVDMYSGNSFNSTIDSDNIDTWNVEEMDD